jgi:hypothetical protein
MINRRIFLHYLLSATAILCITRKSFAANLTVFDDYSNDGEFIIRNGWVLLKSDLDSTNDN